MPAGTAETRAGGHQRNRLLSQKLAAVPYPTSLHFAAENLHSSHDDLPAETARYDTVSAWWRNGQRVGHATPKVAGSTPGLALSGNNLGQVVQCSHTPLSLSSRPTGHRGLCTAAGKVTVGPASHWPCVTDFRSLSTYWFTADGRETIPCMGMEHFTISTL